MSPFSGSLRHLVTMTPSAPRRRSFAQSSYAASTLSQRLELTQDEFDERLEELDRAMDRGLRATARAPLRLVPPPPYVPLDVHYRRVSAGRD